MADPATGATSAPPPPPPSDFLTSFGGLPTDPVRTATQGLQADVTARQGPQMNFDIAPATGDPQGIQVEPQESGPAMQTPTEAPGAYTTEGGAGPTRMSFAQAAPLISSTENPSGDPGQLNALYKKDPKKWTAGGDFQITDTNWKTFAPRVGIDTNQYPTAVSTMNSGDPQQARALQYKVAELMYNEQGFTPWAPYNPKLRKLIGWKGDVRDPATGQLLTGQQAATVGGQAADPFEAMLTESTGAMSSAFGAAEEQYGDYKREMTAARDEQIAHWGAFSEQEKQRYAEAEAYAQKAADLKEERAAQILSDDQKLSEYARQTPTRQAVYATAMHVTPLLAILTAIGGAATGANGMAMLGAMNGLVQGVKEGNENRFQDAYNQWKTTYEAMKDHMENLKSVYDGLIDSYKDRYDAKEKAADHARTSLQDDLQPSQLKAGTSAQLMDASFKHFDNVAKFNAALEKIEEQREIRGLASSNINAMTDRFLATTAFDSGDLNRALSVYGRGRYSLADRERILNLIPQLYVERFGNAEKYKGPMGQQKLMDDAGQYMVAVRANNLAIENAMKASARQAGGISGAAGSMQVLIPQLAELARRVQNNGHFKKFNELKMDYDLQASDPDVAALVEQSTALIADWNIVGARGSGRSTGEERKSRGDKLDAAYDLDTYLTLLNGALVDANAADIGYGQSMQYQHWNPAAAGVLPQGYGLPSPMGLAPSWEVGVPGGQPSQMYTAPPGGAAPGGGRGGSTLAPGFTKD